MIDLTDDKFVIIPKPLSKPPPRQIPSTQQQSQLIEYGACLLYCNRFVIDVASSKNHLKIQLVPYPSEQEHYRVAAMLMNLPPGVPNILGYVAPMFNDTLAVVRDYVYCVGYTELTYNGTCLDPKRPLKLPMFITFYGPSNINIYNRCCSRLQMLPGWRTKEVMSRPQFRSEEDIEKEFLHRELDEILNEISNSENLEEIENPIVMNSTLLPHQKRV